MRRAQAGLGARVRRPDSYRALLTGYGATFLCPSPVSGAIFLLATFAMSAWIGAAVLVGALAATATAHVMRRDRSELEAGLYGFNGILVAFALLSVEGVDDILLLLVAPAAIVTALLMRYLIDSPMVRRANLPPLSLPSLVVAYPMLLIIISREGVAMAPEAMMPAYLTTSDLFLAEFYGAEMRAVVSSLSGFWPVVALLALGYAMHSWRLLAAVLGGVLAAAAVGFAGLGWYGAFHPGFVLITGTPVFVALSSFFTGSGWRSVLFALAGVVLSFPVWFYLGLFLLDRQLPALTAPFFLTGFGMLLLLRLLPPGRFAFLPQAVPLRRVAGPKTSWRWATRRTAGLRYWQQVSQLQERPWQDFSRESVMRRARELLQRSRRVVVLSGAGISTESGIPDYRTGAVAWKKYDTSHFLWERFLSSEESRRKYWEMSQDFFLTLRVARPNKGHTALGELDKRGKLMALVTQNVDRLHQKGGVDPQRVIELHGNEHTVSCLNCGRSHTREEVYRWVLNGAFPPYCPACQGILKPDSVAFGQPMPEAESRRALEAVTACDLLLVVGTSLEVEPAASLPVVALRGGARVLILNLLPTDFDPFADAVLRGPTGLMLPELVRSG